MKTTLVVMALASLALVSCGKKDSKSNNSQWSNLVRGTTNSVVNQGAHIIIPQQSSYANNTAPIIEVNSNLRFQVSPQSTADVKIAIQNMYYNQGGYRLVYQDAQIRKFFVRVSGTCGSTFGQFPGSFNQFPSQFNQNAQCQAYVSNPQAYQQCLAQFGGQAGYVGQPGYGCQNGSQILVQSLTP